MQHRPACGNVTRAQLAADYSLGHTDHFSDIFEIAPLSPQRSDLIDFLLGEGEAGDFLRGPPEANFVGRPAWIVGHVGSHRF
jgi:hypothetical protein